MIRWMVRWLETWLELGRKGGLLGRLERYWIQGEQDEHAAPRWSIMKNVLGRGGRRRRARSSHEIFDL